MIMIGIRSVLLVLHAVEVLSSQYPLNIKGTSRTAVGQMNGGIHIQPVEYSWIAHLEYVRVHNTQCIGSVISARHVLTYSQCVTEELIGVRLGDFAIGTHCRYDGSNCSAYKHFRVEGVCDTNGLSMPNNLALLRLNDTTLSGLYMKRVCLPIRIPQLRDWGYTLMINLNELTAKQAIIIPLLNKIECEIQNGYMMCTGVFDTNADNEKNTCEGDSVSPLKHHGSVRKIIVEGIRPLVQGYTHNLDLCSELYSYLKNGNLFPKTTSTEVPINGIEIFSGIPEYQLPTIADCGYSPIYPRELIDGGYKIEPDEFSWLASLVYGSNQNRAFGYCSGSVISSRYVLTAARCIDHWQFGPVTGVRLGDFENKPYCDYGSHGCRRYQYFDIESFKRHENYQWNYKRMNDIALLKLKEDIVFGDKMKPICLPFGKGKDIEEPEQDSFLTVAGWWTTTFPRDVIAKRSNAVAFWNTTGCMEADRDRKSQICGVKPGESPCIVELGSPLMNMFQRRRMVLEGIAYNSVEGCPGPDVGTLYTKVREYGEWIVKSIALLENRSLRGNRPASS